MLSRAHQRGQGTGDKGARFDNYALGSGQPLATARALLDHRFAERRRVNVVTSVPRSGVDGGIHIGTWIECEDGSLFRLSNVHPGMTIDEAERIAAQGPEV